MNSRNSMKTGGCLPHGIVGRQTPCKKTETCENITFPQLCFRAVQESNPLCRGWKTNVCNLQVNPQYVETKYPLMPRVSQGYVSFMYYLNPVRSLVHEDNSLCVNPPILVLQQMDASDKSSEKQVDHV